MILLELSFDVWECLTLNLGSLSEGGCFVLSFTVLEVYLKVPMKQNYFIILFEMAFKMMKIGFILL